MTYGGFIDIKSSLKRNKLQKNVLVAERPPFYGEEVLRVEWLISTGLTVKRN